MAFSLSEELLAELSTLLDAAEKGVACSCNGFEWIWDFLRASESLGQVEHLKEVCAPLEQGDQQSQEEVSLPSHAFHFIEQTLRSTRARAW